MNFSKLFTDNKIDFIPGDRSGTWINTRCPFCGDKTYNGGFNVPGNYYHCWRCGGHPLYATLSRILNVKPDQLNLILGDYKGRSSKFEVVKKESHVTHLELPNEGFTQIEREYLLSRNFSPRYLHQKYGVTGGGIAGAWKYRIIIPLYVHGKLVSWTGRSVLPKKKLDELKLPRYKNLSIEQSVINPKTVLFNADNVSGKTVVLTEGPFDVLRFDGDAICSFGTELTQAQISEMKFRYNKMFILFDNEPDAQRKARKFGMQLSSIGIDVEIVDAFGDFNKNDMGECTPEEISIIKRELNVK